MNTKDRQGLSFGFGLILIWLTLLTGYLVYDKMYSGDGFTQTIILPPQVQLEPVEFDIIEGV